MSAPGGDAVFAHSVAQLYETHLVPLIFEPYAVDVAERLAPRSLTRVLEIAAGTGVVTRRLASVLPADVAIVATDLNQPMLDQAAAIGTARPVEWRQADAMQLPFEDGSFDAVVCQFGVMFFPDKGKAWAQARRVLRPGGVLIFNAWDRIEENEFADVVTTAVGTLFPADPPRFLARTPYGYHDRAAIARDIAAGGFTADRHRGRPQPRHVGADPGGRLLPWHATSGRDRGPRRIAPRGSDRRRRAGDRGAVRARAGGREDPGARRHRRELSAGRVPSVRCVGSRP